MILKNLNDKIKNVLSKTIQEILDEQTDNQTRYYRKDSSGYYETKLSDYPRKTALGYEEIERNSKGEPFVSIKGYIISRTGEKYEDSRAERLYTEEDLKKMLEEDVKYYLPMLKDLYERAPFSIYFKRNTKYENKLGYIAISDVKKNKYIIRETPDEGYQPYRDNTDDPIIASYNNAEELLYDGWKLD